MADALFEAMLMELSLLDKFGSALLFADITTVDLLMDAVDNSPDGLVEMGLTEEDFANIHQFVLRRLAKVKKKLKIKREKRERQRIEEERATSPLMGSGERRPYPSELAKEF